MTAQEKEQLQYLITRYVDEKSSPKEEAILFYLLGKEDNAKAAEGIIEELMVTEPEWNGYRKKEWNVLIRSIVASGRPPTQHTQVRSLQIRWVAAASILLLSIATAYWIGFKKATGSRHPSGEAFTVQEVVPGHEGAILTLADGTQVQLDSLGNSLLAKQGTTEVLKQNGRLLYRPGDGEGRDNTSAVAYNTITTPKGRQFSFQLSDGSTVWVNAASTVRYPVVFNGRERRVELTGEAYFEVAKNSAKPFHVMAGGTDVEVLGTHFNVNVYTNEPGQRTTLLEGKVSIAREGKTVQLTAGQAALIDNLGSLQVVKDVDVMEAVAWKNGYFSFADNSDLQTVMRQIERWYDVQVDYEGPAPTMRFGGKIGRNSKLSEVLKILEVSKVHFKTEGRKITVIQ